MEECTRMQNFALKFKTILLRSRPTDTHGGKVDPPAPIVKTGAWLYDPGAKFKNLMTRLMTYEYVKSNLWQSYDRS